MATPPLPSISPAKEKSSESVVSPPPPSFIFESIAIPPPSFSILRRVEKSSESMGTLPRPRSIPCRAEKSSESMATLPRPWSIPRRAETSSELMSCLTRLLSICRPISLLLGRHDSDHFLSTAVEDEKSKETGVVPIMGMGGFRRTSLSRLVFGRRTNKWLDAGDSDDFLSAKKSKDEKDMRLIHPASNLEPWRLVSPQGCFKRKITSWRKCKILGKGMDEVMTDDGSFFAVKEFLLLDQGSQGSQSLSQLEQEIKLYRQFEHENIVQCIGTDKDEKKLYVFLELMSKGSLSTLYRKRPLTESQVSAYTRQILEGLKYLHDQNVIHREINCANILVDASGSVKLAGFGLAEATKMNAAKSLKGTYRWMAPEVLNSGKNGSYGLTADIWSLGCTVLEMLTCKPPYSDLEEAQVLEKICKGEPPRVPKFLSEDAQEFICRCLRQNPKERPSEAQLLDHPFVRDPPTSGFA